MIKKRKGLLSLMLSMVLMLSMSATAFAATPAIPGGVTINSIAVTRSTTTKYVGEELTADDIIVTATGSDANTYVLDSTEFTIDDADKTIKSGANTFNITASGKTGTVTFTGRETTALSAVYSGSEVTVGDNVDTTKVTVKASYVLEDDTTKTDETVTDWVIDGTTGKTMTITGAGDNNFTIRYGNKTTPIKITGKPVSTEPDPATATLTATYADESVLVNENFDKSKVKLVWADATRSKNLSFDELETKPTSMRITSTGDNNFTVGYKGKTTTLVVHGYKVDKITASYTGDRVKVGQAIDKDKLKVRLYYTDNKQGLANPTVLSKEQYTVTPATALSSGTTKFTITYSDANADYMADVNVESYGQSDLTVSSMEAKYKDASVLVGSDFNTSDVTITVKYNDGSTEKIGWSKLETKPTEIKVTKAGWNSYEIGYAKATATLQVHGYEVSGIAVEYSGGDLKVGSSIDKSKLKVKVTYSKNYKDETTSEEVSDYTLSADTVTAVGANTITVTYGEKTATFTVNGLDPNAVATAATTAAGGKTQPTTANGNKVVAKTGDTHNSYVWLFAVLFVIGGLAIGGFVNRDRIRQLMKK